MQIASNTCNFISHQLICFVTLEVNTILIGCADAQFQKIPNFYAISRQICIDFFLGHAVLRKLDVLDISFVYSIKSEGPNKDLCETPQEIFSVVDFEELRKHMVFYYK